MVIYGDGCPTGHLDYFDEVGCHQDMTVPTGLSTKSMTNTYKLEWFRRPIVRFAVPAVEFGVDEGLWPESAPVPVERLAVPAVEFGVDEGLWPESAPVPVERLAVPAVEFGVDEGLWPDRTVLNNLTLQRGDSDDSFSDAQDDSDDSDDSLSDAQSSDDDVSVEDARDTVGDYDIKDHYDVYVFNRVVDKVPVMSSAVGSNLMNAGRPPLMLS
jgi:hypothetical protein